MFLGFCVLATLYLPAQAQPVLQNNDPGNLYIDFTKLGQPGADFPPTTPLPNPNAPNGGFPQNNGTAASSIAPSLNQSPADELDCFVGGSVSYDGITLPDLNFNGCIAAVLGTASQITAFFLFMGAVFLNVITYFSITSDITANNTFIVEGWQLFRDLANMLFIFILIYIGIATMLGLGGIDTRKALVRVIVVAILINFSLAISRVVIDASNITALAFYDAFPAGTSENTVLIRGEFAFPNGSKNLAAPFMEAGGLDRLKGGNAFSAYTDTELQIIPLILSYIVTAVLHIIAGFIFFAGGVLFLIRMITLWVIMILAPVAFISYAIPGMDKHYKEWWGKLLHQAFFAPAFLAIIYIAARMFTESGFTKSFEVTGSSFLGDLVNFGLQFAFVGGLLIMALVVSQRAGAYGAKTVLNFGKKRGKAMGGFVGQNTLGRMASGLANSNIVKTTASYVPGIGGAGRRQLQNIGKASFGGSKGGYDKRLKDSVKNREELFKDVEKDKFGNYLGGQTELRDEYGAMVLDKNGKPTLISGAQARLTRDASQRQQGLRGFAPIFGSPIARIFKRPNNLNGDEFIRMHELLPRRNGGGQFNQELAETITRLQTKRQQNTITGAEKKILEDLETRQRATPLAPDIQNRIAALEERRHAKQSTLAEEQELKDLYSQRQKVSKLSEAENRELEALEGLDRAARLRLRQRTRLSRESMSAMMKVKKAKDVQGIVKDLAKATDVSTNDGESDSDTNTNQNSQGDGRGNPNTQQTV